MEELCEKPLGRAIFLNQVTERVILEGTDSSGGASRTDSTPMSFTPEGFATLEEEKFLQLCLLDE